MKLTTVRVVKFVYLADLYFARSADGKTLTGCPWRFVHFGPYCSEVMAELKQASQIGMVEEDRRQSKFNDEDYFLYTCHDQEAEQVEAQIPTSVLYPLRESIRLFGDDTQALLDHVYFETEPMEGVRKGDLLDFSKARQKTVWKPAIIPKLPKQKIEEARKHIERLIEKMEKDRASIENDNTLYPEPLDETHVKALEIMDGEGISEGLTGTAEIIPE